MTEQALQQYLIKQYPKEDEGSPSMERQGRAASGRKSWLNTQKMESNIILYTTDSGSVSIQVQYEDGTFWLTQKRMAELFGVEVPTINYHLKEIYNSEELTEEATICLKSTSKHLTA